VTKKHFFDFGSLEPVSRYRLVIIEFDVHVYVQWCEIYKRKPVLFWKPQSTFGQCTTFKH